MTAFDYQYMLLDTVPITLFWTLAGISIATVIALVALLIWQICQNKKLLSDLDVNESLLTMLSHSNKFLKSKAKHAMYRCNRCGKITAEPVWDSTDPLCAVCWQKHVAIKSVIGGSHDKAN